LRHAPDKFPPEPDRYGLDRFAAEHWIGSHPQLVPCDLSDTAGIHYWYTKDRNQTELNFAMAPRRPLRAPLKLWPVMTDMKKVKLKVATVRTKEQGIFLLPGYIFKWYAILPRVSAGVFFGSFRGFRMVSFGWIGLRYTVQTD
jgi:hypothetical protein